MAGKKNKFNMVDVLEEFDRMLGGVRGDLHGALLGEGFRDDGQWPPFSVAERYSIEDFFLFLDGFDDRHELTYQFYGSRSQWSRLAGADDHRTMAFQEKFEACLLEWLLAEQCVPMEDGSAMPCAEYVLRAESGEESFDLDPDLDVELDLDEDARRYVKALQGTLLSLYEVQALDSAQSRILVCDMLAPQARPEWVYWVFDRDPVWLWDIVGLRLVDWEGERRCASAMLQAPRYAGLHSLNRVQKRLKQSWDKGVDPARLQSQVVAQEWFAVALASGAGNKAKDASFRLDNEVWLGKAKPVFVADTFSVSQWGPLKRAFEHCPDLVPAHGPGYGSDDFGCWYLTAPGRDGRPIRVAFLQRIETGLEMQSPCSDGARDNLERLQKLLGKKLKPAFRRVFPVDRRLAPDGYYQGWCSEPNPYLGGKTPKQAVGLKAWHPVVERLVKDMEFWTAFAADNGWMAPCSVSFVRKELGLD